MATCAWIYAQRPYRPAVSMLAVREWTDDASAKQETVVARGHLAARVVSAPEAPSMARFPRSRPNRIRVASVTAPADSVGPKRRRQSATSASSASAR